MERPLSVDEYHDLIARRVFDGDLKIELLEGVLVPLNRQSKAYAHVRTRLTTRFIRELPRQWSVLSRLPLTRTRSEPEPDLAIVLAEDVEREEHHPRTAALVVEIDDRHEKEPIYAKAGITEYWIVDLERRRIEVCREPRDDAYAIREIVDENGTIRPIAFPAIEVRVADLMMPRAS